MSIVTVDDLQRHLQQTVTFSEFHMGVAQQCLDDAEGAVLTYCEREGNPWTADTCPRGVFLIIERVAGRLLTNPQQRTSYSGPDGLNYTGGPVRLLTDDEREMLNPYKASRKRVGSIRMGIATWLQRRDNDATDPA